MRISAVALSFLAGIVSAIPLAATTTTAVNVNAPCATQPGGAGPTVIPNTVAGFANYPVFSVAALGATLPPSGYTTAYVNFNGSQTGAGYLGYYTLSSYSPNQCATYCNGAPGCAGFDIFFERDPSLNPAAACPNPTAFTNIKCSLWNVAVSEAGSTNFGQYRDQFQVEIAGSNGYNVITTGLSIPTINI